jgi:hypothetical protein
MAYRDNWLRHLLAPVCGEGLSNTLARDFWRDDEDLWNPQSDVQWRWLKLMWVYAASVATQGTFALVIAAMIVSVFKEVPFVWWLIGVGGTTAVLLLFSTLVASLTWVDIWRARRRGGKGTLP